MMMASSSSSSLALIWLYHVFLSFRGEDVRKGFISHVLKEFKSKGIDVFIDNEINRGESVGPVLVAAIRHSKVAVVLLSRNYASSSWCLDELVEIMKCREEVGQTVLTIFYQVDPSHVRKQTGDFGKAFEKTCLRKTEEVKQAWRQALYDVSGIAGYDSSNCDNEADLINKVASKVMAVLGFTPSKDFDDFVGMGARITEIKSKLIIQSKEVKVIGILGPAGIGKTTIATALYNQLSPDFQFNTFLENIRGSYEKPCGNDYRLKLLLQKNMLCQIFKGDIEVSHLGRAQEMLSDKKVLVVLDEVDHWWQLEEMAKQQGWVGPGSTIIITTEDRKLLKALGLTKDHIYRMKYPTEDESLQIFCQYAFGQKFPNHGFERLAWEVTWLAGNLPLGLRVMGSYLRGMSRDEWIQALPWLRSTLDREIESTLRFSYDALRETERTLFLYLACYFTGQRVDYFKMLFANISSEVNHGLQVLVQKSFISIDGTIRMHRLLQQMGRKIVKKQFMENHGKHQFLRLRHIKEIADVVDADPATRKIIGIMLSSEEIQTNKSALQGINSLQFLCYTPEGLDSLHDNLISLCWSYCPLRVWPSKFSGKFLVRLIMQHSKFEMLWEGIKPLPCLKNLDLLSSRNLKKIPDLSEATSLEKLYLMECRGLLKLTSSIVNATKLYRLDISGCTNIKDFPNVPDSIVELDFCRTGIKEVPPWIDNLFRLRKLTMYRCKKLKTISPNISKLENLEFLGLSYSDYHPYTDHYEDDPRVDMRDDAFEATIEWGDGFKRSWKLLSDFNVHYILPRCLPEKVLTSPISLRLSNMIGIKTIPDCIRRLSGLIKLDVRECIELVAIPPLPDSLVFLDAQGCEYLKRIDSSSFQNPNICLDFAKCFKLKLQARKLIQTSACKYAILPGEKVSSHFTHRASSDSLTISLTPRTLPSSFRFKACILLSNVYDHPEDNNDDDEKEGENSLRGLSYSVRGTQNGLTAAGGSNQIHMPDLYRPCQFSLNQHRPPLREYREHLYIFEDSFTLNKDCLGAEETTFSELTFLFRVHDKPWKVKGCGVRLLEANSESVGGEDDGEDEDEDEEDDEESGDDDGEDKDEEEDEDSGDEDDDDDDEDSDGDDDDEGGHGDKNKVGENDYPHSFDSLSNQSSPFSRGTPSSRGPIRYPSAFPQYSSLPPRTSTVQTFEYNQGGPAIDPQSGTGMTCYAPPTSMQSGFSRSFYGNPMHQGGPIRHMPPHPSAIPQYSSNPYASLPPRTSTVQTFGYNQGGTGTTEVQQQSGQAIDPQSDTGMTSYPSPTLMQSGYSRPFYGNPTHQGGDKQQQNMLPIPQSLIPHSIPQQLPSMQLQRPMQPPQHVRPSLQIPHPSEQGLSLQSQYQIPLHPMQMIQQTQVQPYYHPPQQQEISYQIALHPMQMMQQTQVQPYYHPPQQQDLSYQIPLHPMQMMQQTQVQPYYHPPQQQDLSYQIPLHPMQLMQQTQVQPYYLPPQQQEISHVQQQQLPHQQAVQSQQGSGSSQRQESGMSLHDWLY